MDLVNYYDTLGISPTCNDNDVKKAYHRIARRHHPDRARDGNVEIFKQATLAYEILSDQQKRKDYDTQLSMAKLQRMNSQWSSSSGTGNSAAAAAFNSAATAAFNAATNAFKANSGNNGFKDERVYMRRPQETRFSRRYQGFSPSSHPEEFSTKSKDRKQEKREEEKDKDHSKDNKYTKAADFVDLTGEPSDSSSPSDSSHSQSARTEKSHSPFSHYYSSDKQPSNPPPKESIYSFLHQTQSFSKQQPSKHPEEAQRFSSKQASPKQSSAKYSPPKEASPIRESNKPAKRSAAVNDDLPQESPSKKMRVFDFSELKNTPPFTQKNGTSFSFDAVNAAINDGIMRPNARARQYNRRTQLRDHEASQKIEQAIWRSRVLLNQYAKESRQGFDELFKMHNQRVAMTAEPVVDPGAILQSFKDTEQVLEGLLLGTREYIKHFPSN